MTTSSSRFFDEVAKLMTNAAGAAQGVRKELDTLVKTQVERVLGDLDVVQREEFEAVRAMAQKARDENDALSARISQLEIQIASAQSAVEKPPTKKSSRKSGKSTAATKAQS